MAEALANQPGVGAGACAGAQPVQASERIAAIDSLRGFAVLGILIMNIYAFAMPFAAYANPLVWGGTDALNVGTWFVTHLLADQKFITIFSMLFGAGIVLQTQRAERRGAAAMPVFFRRQGWLAVIALIHGYLLWFGDILLLYALIGMAVFWLRQRSARSLLIAGLALLLVTPLLSAAMGSHMAELRGEAEKLNEQLAAGVVLTAEQQARVEEWEETREFMAPTNEELVDLVSLYQQGSYSALLMDRAPLVTQVYGFSLLNYGWRVAALMILGMALMKRGVLTARRPTASYGWFMGLGYGLGIPLAAVSAAQLASHGFDAIYAFKLGANYNYVASLLVALGHIGLVMWLARTGALRGLMGRLAAVGRMALTHYLTHTAVMTTIFYSYGLGLFGQIPRFQQMFFVAGLLGLQLLVSPLWLKYFRFGPVEWPWRSLSYGSRQPFRQPVPG